MYNRGMKRLIFALCALLVLSSAFCSCSEKSETPTGEFINSVVLVNLSGENPFGEKEKQIVNDVFFDGENSLGGYISFVSEGKVAVKTQIVGEVFLNKTKEYYLPAYEEEGGEYKKINEDGYDNRRFALDGSPSTDGEKTSADAFFRSEELIAEVNSELSGNFVTDGNGDGAVDCLTFVFNLSSLDENSLLWAKKGTFFYGKTEAITSAYVTEELNAKNEIKQQKVGDKSINDYIFLPYSLAEVGGKANSFAACHEILHVFGAADMYPYGSSKEYAGELDIMASSGGAVPSMPLSYTRYKAGFLTEGENIAPVLKSGKHTLFSTESGKGKVKAYKLVLPEYSSKKESFYIEYREKTGYGAELSNSFEGGAFIVYRVNEENGYISPNGSFGGEYLGNAYGAAEVYVFRFGQKTIFGGRRENEKISANNISHAAISDLPGYGVFGKNEGVSGAISYSDGTDSGVKVSFVRRNADGSATFDITFDYDEKVAAEVDYQGVSYDKAGNFVGFYAPFSDKNVYVLEADKKLPKHSPEDVVNGKYGEAKKTPAAFMRTRLTEGKKYVYVVYEKDGSLKEEAYALGASEKDVVKTAVILSAAIFGGGVVVFVLALLIAKKIVANKGGQSKKTQKSEK